jgi:hypothetical protein
MGDDDGGRLLLLAFDIDPAYILIDMPSDCPFLNIPRRLEARRSTTTTGLRRMVDLQPRNFLVVSRIIGAVTSVSTEKERERTTAVGRVGHASLSN